VTARPRVVAFGGGHGLYASLQALRTLDVDLTAVVTVADDGGSSGRLRRELDVLPPGDLRQALVALADDQPSGPARPGEPAGSARPAHPAARTTPAAGPVLPALFQHRLGGSGALAGHAVGNLVLTGLMELLGGPVPALAEAGRLLGARGRVLPMSVDPLEIEAEAYGVDPDRPDEVTLVRGQVAVATTPGRVHRVRLLPERPAACDEAVAAVRAADWLVLGPGSWFTSVLPHLLVPDLAAAVLAAPARRLVTLNLAAEPGETAGLSAAGHLAALAAHAPGLRVDVVLADPAGPGGGHPSGQVDSAALDRAAQSLGGRLVLAPVALGDGTARHDPGRLAAALAGIIDGQPLREGLADAVGDGTGWARWR